MSDDGQMGDKPELGLHQMTVAQAKDVLRAGCADGVNCPACGQHVKVYERTITSAMAYGLILLRRHDARYRGAWVHLEDYLKALDIPSSIRGDMGKLRHWKLTEVCSGTREDGSKRIGLHRITHSGIEFVERRLSVQKYARLYNNRCLGFKKGGGEITIDDALGKKFSYREVMQGGGLAPSDDSAAVFDPKDAKGAA